MVDGPNEPRSPLDREIQRGLLLEMQAAYPSAIAAGVGSGRVELSADQVTNLSYLNDHGMCVAKLAEDDAGVWHWGSAKITVRGLDFLADDGGLGAILNVVTVKLHADTVRELIAAKIDASAASPVEKSELKEQLKKLPAKPLEQGSAQLMKIGVEHLPDVGRWLHALMGLL